MRLPRIPVSVSAAAYVFAAGGLRAKCVLDAKQGPGRIVFISFNIDRPSMIRHYRHVPPLLIPYNTYL